MPWTRVRPLREGRASAARRSACLCAREGRCQKHHKFRKRAKNSSEVAVELPNIISKNNALCIRGPIPPVFPH